MKHCCIIVYYSHDLWFATRLALPLPGAHTGLGKAHFFLERLLGVESDHSHPIRYRGRQFSVRQIWGIPRVGFQMTEDAQFHITGQGGKAIPGLCPLGEAVTGQGLCGAWGAGEVLSPHEGAFPRHTRLDQGETEAQRG